MLNSLTLFETYCSMSNISEVTKSDVINFLSKFVDINVSNNFKDEYLHSA